MEIKKQLDYKNQFITFNEGSKLSFEARFQHYMKQMTKEEEVEQEKQEKEKLKKQSQMSTNILIQDNDEKDREKT